MWNKIQYALIYSWVKVHALLPMWALYILSDILYVLVYKVVRYRVKVVRQNMKASFPDKSDTELRRLEREFYHHFADYVVETIKLAHISLEELQRRKEKRGSPLHAEKVVPADGEFLRATEKIQGHNQ